MTRYLVNSTQPHRTLTLRVHTCQFPSIYVSRRRVEYLRHLGLVSADTVQRGTSQNIDSDEQCHDDGGRTLDVILHNATKTNHRHRRYIRHVFAMTRGLRTILARWCCTIGP